MEAKSIGLICFTLPEAINSCSLYTHPENFPKKKDQGILHAEITVLQLPKPKELLLSHAATKSPHAETSAKLQAEAAGAGAVAAVSRGWAGAPGAAPEGSQPSSAAGARAGQGRQLQKAGTEKKQAPCSTSRSDFQALPQDTTAEEENKKPHWVQPKAKHPKPSQHCTEHARW